MTLILLPLLLAATQTLPVVTSKADDPLAGRWVPNAQANTELARSQMRAKGMPSLADLGLPMGGKGGMGGMGGAAAMGGAGMGGKGGKGGKGGIGMKAAMLRSKLEAAQKANDSSRLQSPEGKMLAPTADPLLVAKGADAVTFASGPDGLLQLPADGKPILLGDGKSYAHLQRDDGDLALHLDHPGQVEEVLRYHLEGDGRRLRVFSTITTPALAKPITQQKLYDRGPGT